MLAFVSDQGDVVVQAHMLEWGAEDLLFFDRAGRLSLRVTVCAPNYFESDSDDDSQAEGAGSGDVAAAPKASHIVWADEHVRATTAGPMWSEGALRVFLEVDAPIFSMRTAWGRRLVVDLARMELVEDALLEARLRTAESQVALQHLRVLAPRAGSGSLTYDEWSDLMGGLAVVISHALEEAVPELCMLEARDAAREGFGSSAHVLGRGWSLCHNKLRSMARLALRALGREPSASPSHTFGPSFGEPGAQLPPVGRFPAGVRVFDEISPGANAFELLLRVGAPDDIRAVSKKLGKSYVWSESWEYDFDDRTVQVNWAFPPDSSRASIDAPRVVESVHILRPPRWRDHERLLRLLLLAQRASRRSPRTSSNLTWQSLHTYLRGVHPSEWEARCGAWRISDQFMPAMDILVIAIMH